jgi:hypothetical protein
MDGLIRGLGIGLVILALVDVYLTVLYPRLDVGFLSIRLIRGGWWSFRTIASILPDKGAALLVHSGPVLTLLAIAVWVMLLVIGFGLIVWVELGTGIQASQGQTPTDFWTALYYSGYSLTTLGVGDLLPKTGFQRMLSFIQAGLGFSTFTLTITYLLSIYTALIHRNSLALSLHHQTANTADSIELLARIAAGDRVNDMHNDISSKAKDLMILLESQRSYPVLLYFRYQQTYYALPRMLWLSIDTATLIKSALDPQAYRAIVNSGATEELWGSSMQMLKELSNHLFPQIESQAKAQDKQQWREHYHIALKRLEMEGINTVADPESGADLYVSLRQQWEPYLSMLVRYMSYRWSDIAPPSPNKKLSTKY